MMTVETRPIPVEPRGNDHFLTLVKGRLYRDGPRGEGTVVAGLNSLDSGVGDAVSDLVDAYHVRDGIDSPHQQWLDALRESMRERAMEAVMQAFADELQLWLAARAAGELESAATADWSRP